MELASEKTVEQMISEQLEKAGIKCHPMLECVPFMSRESFLQFFADVKANGMVVRPIMSAEGFLLDGRHRLAAFLLAGGNIDDVDFIILPSAATDVQSSTEVGSLNLNRRHLTPSQAAMLLAELKAKGADVFDLMADLPTSKESVERATRVLRHGSQALVSDVKSGAISVSQADKIATGKAPIVEAAKTVSGYETFDMAEDDGNAEPANTPAPKRAGRPAGNTNINRLNAVVESLCKLIEVEDNIVEHLRLTSSRRENMTRARGLLGRILDEDKAARTVCEQTDGASATHH